MSARYVVRYGVMRSLGVLSVQGKERIYARGERVIARTKRGLEVGEVLCEATPAALEGSRQMEQGEILRAMSSSDTSEVAHMENQTSTEFEKCQEYVEQQGLDMELVDIERVFGGERIIVYYLSENRVDFRELVRQLAREFQTRIEMRQIGVRDEAKLLADYGDCGKPVCCNNHLSSMPPVSMKMAKIQKATLDPNKISGRCGRLKCCLRYEYDTYLDMQKELPTVGSEIVTREGKATVLSQEILAGQLLVQNEDNRRVLIDAADVLSVTRVGTGRVQRGSRRSNPKSADETKETAETTEASKSTVAKSTKEESTSVGKTATTPGADPTEEASVEPKSDGPAQTDGPAQAEEASNRPDLDSPANGHDGK